MLTSKQRNGLDSFQSGFKPAGKRKVKKFADGGKVDEPIPKIEVTAKRMTPAEEKAYDESQKAEPRRTVNGAPIRNPRPATIAPSSGGVRG